MTRFRQTCRQIKPGVELARVRELASEHRLVFEEDPEPTGFLKGEPFVIRPWPAWPYRYGCKFAASAGFITDLRK